MIIKNIGICGAHRTGKTTLAKSLNMPFIEIGTSSIFADNKLDPAKHMDFRARIWIQQKILARACNIWDRASQSFVCDRTPIDMAAYTLAEVQGNTLDEELEFELSQYLYDCKEATEKYFSYLVLVPPAIPITAAKGKASLSKGYIEHIHTLVTGLFHQSPVTGYEINRANTSLNKRIADVKRFLLSKIE